MRFLYFRADWCGVCHAKGPVAREIALDRDLPLEVLDIETEAGGAEAERRRIRTVPTLALVEGERVRFRLIGEMISPENVSFLMAKL